MAKGFFIVSILVALVASGAWFFFPDLSNSISHPALQQLKESVSNSLHSVWNGMTLSSAGSCVPEGERLFTQHSLKLFDGSREPQQVYLAFLGIV